ncbi:type VII toxin-antitoxin system HepT family RNase toxin [Aquipuribacter nitratireducens]|uniref:DUF86 domain-containing protein n=1 Tax=Aquipuribacter nitratireducens TaxID=650104 RepID=A0ABW0GPD5_9MICO
MEPLVDRLASLRGVSGDELRADLDTRLVVERILTVLVESAAAVNGHVVGASGGQVPDDYRSSFGAAAAAGAIRPELAGRLAPAAGLRNLLAHRYGEVDLDLVAAAVPRAHDDFRDYITQVAGWLTEQGTDA